MISPLYHFAFNEIEMADMLYRGSDGSNTINSHSFFWFHFIATGNRKHNETKWFILFLSNVVVNCYFLAKVD